MSLLKNRSSMVLFHDEIGHRSQKVRIILQEKEISCDLEALDSYNVPKEILDVNPDGSLPLLIDRELSLYNSALIVEYLDERFPHPPLLPVYPVARANCRTLMLRIDREWCPMIDALIEGKKSEKELMKIREALLHEISSIAPTFKEFKLNYDLLVNEYLEGKEFSKPNFPKLPNTLEVKVDKKSQLKKIQDLKNKLIN